VIPVWNAARFVEETVRSVLAQDYRPLEIVVVDDGSTDDSVAVVRRLAAPEVRLLVERNGGVGRARNVGLAAARGDLVTFLDHDDVLTEGSIARRVEELRAVPGRFVYGRLAWLGPSPDGSAVSPGPDHEAATTYEAAWGRLGITTPGQALLLRADAVAAGGFPEERHLGGSDDRGFWLRLVARGVLPSPMPDVVLRYRVHAGQASRTVAYKRARLAMREAAIVGGDPPRRLVAEAVAAPVLARLAMDLAHDLLDTDPADAHRVADAARARWPALVQDDLWSGFHAKARRKSLGRLPVVGPVLRACARTLSRPAVAGGLALAWAATVLALYGLARVHRFAPFGRAP
jgi:hypothetical protein